MSEVPRLISNLTSGQGYYFSDAGGVVYHRSRTERKFMIIADYLRLDLEYEPKHLGIMYRDPDTSEMHSYTPDFCFYDSTGRYNVIETKRELREKGCPWNQAKWKAAREYCAKHGYIFQVWYDETDVQPLLDSIVPKHKQAELMQFDAVGSRRM